MLSLYFLLVNASFFLPDQVKNVSCLCLYVVPAKPVVQTAGSLVSDMQISKKIKERLGKKTSVSEVSSTTDEPVSTKSGGLYF